MDYSFLCGVWCLVDSEDIRVFFGIFDDYSADKAGKVAYMDSWYEVLAVANNGQTLWILDPSFLEMVVKCPLAVAIADARTQNVHSQIRLSLDRRHCNSFKRFQVLILCVWNSQMVIRLLEKDRFRNNDLFTAFFVLFLLLFLFFVFLFLWLSLLLRWLLFSFSFCFLKLRWRVDPCHDTRQ